MNTAARVEPDPRVDEGDEPDPGGSPSHGGLRFRPDIEGLRAVAVMAVVLSHLDVPGFGAGFVGVDVFFVISGYLITSLLAKEYEESRLGEGRGRISLAGFYRRRALRILPAAITVIAATLVAGKFILNSVAFVRLQADALWATFFATNIQLIREATDYFQAGLSASPLQNYWSLAVEEQFYLVWPLCFLLVAAIGSRYRRAGGPLPAVRLALGLIALASLAWSIRSAGVDPAAGYFSTLTRAWQLALGALIAVTPALAAGLGARGRAVVGVAGSLLLVAALVLCGGDRPYPGAIALLPTLGAALIILAGVRAASLGPAGRVLALGAPRAIGRISYSLYLWHWPIIVLAGIELGSDARTVPARIALLLLSVSAATISYFAIERPFVAIGRRSLPGRGRGRSGSRARLAVLLIVPVASLIVVVAWARPIGVTESGIPVAGEEVPKGKWLEELKSAARSPRITRAEYRLGERMAERRLVRGGDQETGGSRLRGAIGGDGCLSVTTVTNYRQAALCSAYGDGRAHISWPSSVKPKAALVGNSFAGQWAYQLQRVLPRDVLLVPLTVTSCRTWERGETGQVDARGYSCDRHRKFVTSALRRARPGLVIVSFQRVSDHAAQMRDTTALIRELRALAPNVLLVGPAPVLLPFDRCLSPDLKSRPCSRLIGPNDWRDDRDFRRATAAGGGDYFSTQRLLCSGLICPAFIAGRPTRFDGIHVTRWSARGLGLFLADAVERSVGGARSQR